MKFKRKKNNTERLINSFGKLKDDTYDFDLIEKYFQNKDNTDEFQILSNKTCIDLDFQATEDIRISHLEKVWLDKYDVSPGEIIRVKVFTRGFRGERIVQDGATPAPLPDHRLSAL